MVNQTSALSLAALATVAAPELKVESLCPPSGADEDFCWTGVLDTRSHRWTVLMAQHDEAAEALEKQQKILTMLGNYQSAHRLPFEVPHVEGKASSAAGHPAIVYRQLPGNPLDFNDLETDPELPYAVGRAIAALHEIQPNLVEHVGFPVPTVAEIRAEMSDKLDAASQTGLVPGILQARWQQALDEDAWWHFHPTFVHGALSEDTVLTADSRVLGILDFAHVSVGDPARDLAWLVTQLTDEVTDRIFDAYHIGRTYGTDSFLRQRTELYGEFGLVDWLNWGLKQGDAAIIADAQDLMDEQLNRLDGNYSLTGHTFEDLETDTIALEPPVTPTPHPSDSASQLGADDDDS